jgi:uncharacterized membrane protein YfcA
MAYIGGAMMLPKAIFYWVLLISLVFVVARIYFWPSTTIKLNLSYKKKITFSILTGSLLGLAAGIGGGIFLVPLILVFGLGTEKEAAACGAIFIWLNSMSGMIARLQHNSVDLSGFIPLVIAVWAGGAMGSFLGSFKFSPKIIENHWAAYYVSQFFSNQKIVDNLNRTTAMPYKAVTTRLFL